MCEQEDVEPQTENLREKSHDEVYSIDRVARNVVQAIKNEKYRKIIGTLQSYKI